MDLNNPPDPASSPHDSAAHLKLTRPLSAVLALANGAVLCATVLFAWLTSQPFMGGGPQMTATLGTLVLLSCASGAVLASLLRRFGKKPLARAILWLITGSFLLVAQMGHARVLELLEPYGLLSAVAAAFCCFFAMPVALQCALLLTTEGQKTSPSSRWILASTAAAVTFSSLILVGLPLLGVAKWMTIASIVALSCSTLLFGSATMRRRAQVALIFGVVVIAATAGLVPHPGPNRLGVRVLAHTGTQELRILDHKGYRYLLVDGEPRVAVDPSTGDASAPDPSTLELMLQFFWPPGRCLFVGMAEPSLVHALTERGWHVDIAEQPQLLELAVQHLGLDAQSYASVSPETIIRKLLRGDALVQENLYHIIVVQTRGSARQAQPLATRSGIKTLRRMLHQDAILLFRIEAPGWEHQWPQAIGATLLQQFNEVWALPVTGGPKNAGALVLAASDRYLEIRHHDLPTPQDHPFHPEAQLQSGRARNAWLYRFVPEGIGAPILELARNDSPYWLEEFHAMDRRRLHHRLGGRSLTW